MAIWIVKSAPSSLALVNRGADRSKGKQMLFQVEKPGNQLGRKENGSTRPDAAVSSARGEAAELNTLCTPTVCCCTCTHVHRLCSLLCATYTQFIDTLYLLTQNTSTQPHTHYTVLHSYTPTPHAHMHTLTHMHTLKHEHTQTHTHMHHRCLLSMVRQTQAEPPLSIKRVVGGTTFSSP